MSEKGFIVRILSRKCTESKVGIDQFQGDLSDYTSLVPFLSGAMYLIHCAAELKDTAAMWKINVEGTKELIRAAEYCNIKFFCFLSSVGVFGNTGDNVVGESSCCNPINDYGKSKLEAEKIILRSQQIPQVIILRPTNVVAPEKPNTLSVVLKRNIINRIKVFVQGKECCHAVHVNNVVAAVLFFMSKTIESPQVYIVSSDDNNNTFSNLLKIWKTLKLELPIVKEYSLPLFVPDFLRKIYPRKTISGRVRYSSHKLINSGFIFPMDVASTVEDIFYNHISDK